MGKDTEGFGSRRQGEKDEETGEVDGGWQAPEGGWPRYRNSHRALPGEDVHRLCPEARRIRVTSTFSSLPRASLPALFPNHPRSGALLQTRTYRSKSALPPPPPPTPSLFFHPVSSSAGQPESQFPLRASARSASGCCPSSLFSFRGETSAARGARGDVGRGRRDAW